MAWGQSYVSEMPNNPSDTSIVRYWDNNISIVYAYHRSDKDKHFLLVDETSPTVLRISVPEEVTVNDFRILNGKVYIGGNHVNNAGVQRGLLAFFDIQDFYNGSGNYNWELMLRTPMPDCYDGGCQNQIYDITRLAVYNDVQAGPQIAYIGKNYIVGDTSNRVGVGWATYYLGLWQNYIIYNKHAIEEYTDIIATENYVVAVARTNDSARIALRMYPKNNFLYPTGPWPSNPFYYNPFGRGLADLEVDGNVMATALDGDEFAVAYHYINSPKEGLAVKTFAITGGGVSASLLQSLVVPIVRQPGSTWKMRDIRYSSSLHLLAVLNDIDRGTVGSPQSIVYQFQLPTLSVGTHLGGYLPGSNLYALDLYGLLSQFFVASGNVAGGGPLSLYREFFNSESACGQKDMITGDKTNPKLYETYMTTNMNQPNNYYGVKPFVVEAIDKTVICIAEPKSDN